MMCMHASWSRVAFSACALIWLVACGATQKPAPTPAPETRSAEWSEPPDQMQVTGIMGTIPERKIRATLEPVLPSFARCFAREAGEVEFIGGHMEFYFRVGLDGKVEWVYPRASDVGHRATEQCLLDIAKGVRFPGPKGGGAAEVGWGFDFEPSDGARPPVAWGTENAESVRSQIHALARECQLEQGSLMVTAYVTPGGQVLAAGASADSPQSAAQIDCVVGAVRGFTFADPGSYTAKLSFSVP